MKFRCCPPVTGRLQKRHEQLFWRPVRSGFGGGGSRQTFGQAIGGPQQFIPGIVNFRIGARFWERSGTVEHFWSPRVYGQVNFRPESARPIRPLSARNACATQIRYVGNSRQAI